MSGFEYEAIFIGIIVGHKLMEARGPRLIFP